MPTDAEFDELVERVDNLATRLGTMSNVAAQHGERHADRGEDPIEGELVTGHTHGAGPTPVIEATAISQNTGDGVIDLPSGIVSGDLLVVEVASSSNVSITWPAGWTDLFEKINGSAVSLGIGYREADGSEGSTVTITNDKNQAAIAYRISGARVGQTATPIEASAGASGSGTSANPDSLTPSGGNKNYLWLPMGAVKATGDFSAAPTNYSNLLTIDYDGAGDKVIAGAADRALNASVEDPGVFTNPSGSWAAATAVIFPDETLLHSGSPDVHHTSFIGLQDNADSTIDPEDDDRIKVTDDGIVNADKSGNNLALSILMARIFLGLATEDLIFIDAGSASATQQDWIQVTVGGNTGYIHVFAAK